MLNKHIHSNPFIEFDKWLNEAKKNTEINLYNAVVLGTVDKNNRPETRTVLLKGHSESGFIFYTNSHSQKGKSLKINPFASLTFHWEKLGKQVNIRGTVSLVDPIQSDAYFATRPRGSQISAWASKQSTTIKTRNELEEIKKKYIKEFEGKPVPRPKHWNGYLLKPDEIEFWVDRQSRFHDRFLFKNQTKSIKKGSQFSWKMTRLCP